MSKEMELLLKILCEINNRLSDIALTLQTLGSMMLCDTGEKRQQKQVKITQLLEEQYNKYAKLETPSGE